MPGDAPTAFILVPHLDPSHDGMALQPGVLRVIPPGVFLSVMQRALQMSGTEDDKPVQLPFDVQLRSLSRDAADGLVIA